MVKIIYIPFPYIRTVTYTPVLYTTEGRNGKERYIEISVDTPIMTAKFRVWPSDIVNFEYYEHGDGLKIFNTSFTENGYWSEDYFLSDERFYDIQYKSAEYAYKAVMYDQDLYSKEAGIYVYHYNGGNAICYYHVTVNPEEIQKEAKEKNMRWEEMLSGHGYVISKKSAAIDFFKGLEGTKWANVKSFA